MTYQLGTIRTSTFTIASTAFLRLVVAGLFVSLSGPGSHAQTRTPPPNDDIEHRVRQLGLDKGNDDLADVRALSKTPYESVGALISELHTIANPERAGLDDSPATEHLISAIAALRYLTGGSDFYTVSGKDFCAKTKWVFSASDEEKNRLYWLYFGHPNCVSFFSIWPSRYRVYLAPLDAQQEIIRQWRQWFATDGKAYRFTPPPDSPEKRSLLWQCARAVYSPPQGTQK